jgi:hypothetical protein
MIPVLRTPDPRAPQGRDRLRPQAQPRMLHRLGFRREGTFHEYFHEDGAFHDIAPFVKLRRHQVS